MATTDTVLITAPACTFCGKSATVEITADESAALNRGEFIQQALATRTPAFREVIISGTHGECWDAIFGGDDEDE